MSPRHTFLWFCYIFHWNEYVSYSFYENCSAPDHAESSHTSYMTYLTMLSIAETEILSRVKKINAFYRRNKYGQKFLKVQLFYNNGRNKYLCHNYFYNNGRNKVGPHLVSQSIDNYFRFIFYSGDRLSVIVK